MIAITRHDLARMYPRALPQWIDALERLAPILIDHYGFTRLDWCGIAGQIDAETDGLSLRSMQEDMRFSASRMLEVYSKRLGDCVGIPVPPLGGRVFASKAALARALAGNPIATADVVYGGPRGREGTPPWCGSKYIGRGPLQETHLNNYRAARDEIRRQPGGDACPDLVEHPELLATDPELGVRNVFGQWKTKGLSKYARRKDWATLSDVLNTGNPNDNVKPFGLPRRLRATARALAIWPAESVEPMPQIASQVRVSELSAISADLGTVAPRSAVREGDKGDCVKVVQERLRSLGYAVGPVDGKFGILTTRAVVAFQSEHGLKPDGIVGPRTLEVMGATAPAVGPHTAFTAADLTGSSTIGALKWGKRAIGSVFGLNAGVVADDQLGLGLVDAAVSKGEQIKGLIGRAIGLGIPAPSSRVVAAVAIAGGCAGLIYLLRRAEWGRVEAAKRGG